MEREKEGQSEKEGKRERKKEGGRKREKVYQLHVEFGKVNLIEVDGLPEPGEVCRRKKRRDWSVSTKLQLDRNRKV
jgi:hypothetical protein